MASATGSTTQKHHHTTCCDCFGRRTKKQEKVNPLSIGTPHPLTKSTKNLTEKDIQDFSKLVKADEFDEKLAQQNADESISEDEVKDVATVFKKIHGEKED